MLFNAVSNDVYKKEHKVEDQWHYSIMIEHGFEPITKVCGGFVRSYSYKKNNHEIICTTGTSCDYWDDKTIGKGGVSGDLKRYLKTLE